MATETIKIQENEPSAEQQEEIKTAAVIVPPDSGWSWVVMIASFLCCTVIDGIVFCSGLIQDSILQDFHVSKGYVAFVSSLLSGCYLLAGPFVSALANRFGFRPVTIVGALFAALSFVLSYYATSVEFLFLTYGIMGGIGFCMVYIPAVVIIGFYFEKWRALATGLAMCGSGVGTFIFAPVTNILLEHYGWRGTLAIQGAIITSCALFGLAFKPIQPITFEASETMEEDGKVKHFKNQVHAIASRPPIQNTLTKPLPEGRYAYSMPNSAHNTFMGNSPKHHYPTAAEIFKGCNFERRPSNVANKGTELKTIRKSHPTTPNSDQHQFVFNVTKELSTVGENENEEESENENLLTLKTKANIVQTRRHTVSGRRPNDLLQKRKLSSHDVNNQNSIRPMYRDDIFFTGSLTRVPQYTSQTSLAYHMSVTRLPTKQDIEPGCQICPEAIRRTLSTMLDISLLKSPSFMLLASSGFLTMMGFFVPFTFLVRRAVLAGMDQQSALNVVSGIGLVNTLARIVCGTISSFPNVKPLWLNNIAITAGGVATIFSGVIITETTQWIFAIFFGVCIACFSALRSIIAVEMIGLEKLTNAFGFLMLFQGLAAVIGSPIAGAMYDATGSYDVSFYFAGGLILLSAFLCYPLTWVSNWEKARNKESETKC